MCSYPKYSRLAAPSPDTKHSPEYRYQNDTRLAWTELLKVQWLPLLDVSASGPAAFAADGMESSIQQPPLATELSDAFRSSEQLKPFQLQSQATPETPSQFLNGELRERSKADASRAHHRSEGSRSASSHSTPTFLGCSKAAWIQVLASFLINMNVYGLVNAFGDFQHFYETQYLASYTNSEISWIGTVQGSLTLLGGALAGPLFDRGYFMITLQVAGLLLVVSWMILSVCKQYYQILLVQGFLAGICVGLMEVPSIALIPQVVPRKRIGLALGCAISGAPMGGLIYSVVFRAVLGAASFAWSTRCIGFIVLLTLGVAVAIIKPRDASRKSIKRRFLDLTAFKEWSFISLLVDAFFLFCSALIPFFITPAYAVSVSSD